MDGQWFHCALTKRQLPSFGAPNPFNSMESEKTESGGITEFHKWHLCVIGRFQQQIIVFISINLLKY